MLLLFELILGTLMLWHGRRWLVARLDETFGNRPENFDTDEDMRGWPGFAAIVSFFVVIALLSYYRPEPWAGMTLLFGVPLLAWTLGNLSNWRRLEPGNPLRESLDPVLASEGIRPSIVRLWRNPALLPTFTFDGRIDIPSAFVRHFSPEEHRFLYLALVEETTVRLRRRLILQWILALAGVGGFFLLVRYFHIGGVMIGVLGPMFSAGIRGPSVERRLTLNRLKTALEKTGDFATAERAIFRVFPETMANKVVSDLREWWAVQNPASPTVAAMRNSSVSPTQQVGLGP